jgi:2-polyprenyl-3-methyl-5-hydroxy-6-metoxy-1,4-benzoquinol methylase
MRATGACRFCESPLGTTFVDLGVSPLANSYLRPDQLQRMEPFYPLHAYVCDACLLVQLEEFESPEEIFGDYAYFSSYSDTLLAHAKAYCEAMTERFGIGASSHVVEVASNDGYLLRNFVEVGVPVTGIEPAANVAKVAVENGVPTLVEFFGEAMAGRLRAAGKGADLIAANNVLAHVPAINDFVRGMKVLLNPTGVVTVEFPHLMRLMEHNQFDTIYHEHFSYFSFLVVERIFATHGLVLFDVEEIPTHGGSLRIFARHAEDVSKPVSGRVEGLRAREIADGFDRVERYTDFGAQVAATKRALLAFLIEQKEQGRQIVGYGAAAKGNTLLNYCGIGPDFLDYVVDRSPHKQNQYLPGSRIPVVPAERLAETKPDFVLILAWNLKDEVMESMRHVREWGGRFVVPIPRIATYE